MFTPRFVGPFLCLLPAMLLGGNDPGTATPLIQSVNAVAGGVFQAASNYGAGTNPAFAAIGDFDGDTKLDLVATNNIVDSHTKGAVNVLLGNGDGTFKPPVAYNVGGNPVFVIAVDLNHDNKTDLVVGNGQKYVSVLLGTGNGTFSPAVQYPVNNPMTSGAIGDFNGDGKPDLVIGESNGSVAVLIGGGDGSFGSPIETPGAADSPAFLAVGNFNADTNADIAVTDTFSKNVNVLLGNGNGSFGPPVPYKVGDDPQGVAVGDFDGNGKSDLVVANARSNTFSVLLGNGDGSFRAAVNYGAGIINVGGENNGPFPYSVAVGDLNGDGKADFVAANVDTNTVSIFFGDGTGAFHAPVNYPVDAIPVGVAVGDFSSDGRLDLVTVNNGNADVSVLLNLPPAPYLQVTLIDNLAFQRGIVSFQGGPAYTITVRNVGSVATSGTVTVTDPLPPGVTVTTIGGTGWTCVSATATCTRSDPLNPLASYPDITLAVNIAASAPNAIANTVSVTGGGQLGQASTARDFTPDFSSDDVPTAWTSVTLPSGLTQSSTPLLLTDGSVMVQQYCSSNWFKLTPDIFGSYANGTWNQLASMPAGYGPLYYASAVLPDGRVVAIGGEYNQCASNNADLVDSALGAVYDPKANAWTPLSAPSGWTSVGDASSVVLPGGQFLLADISSTKLARLDAATLTWTQLNASGKADNNDEEGWTLLPDGSFLTVDITALPGTERYLPQSDTWVSAGKAPGPLSAQGEIGPQVLRPDGTVFVAGASGHTGIYNSVTGNWAAGPDFPVQNGIQLAVLDTAAVLLPSGNVFLSQGNGYYFEFDGTHLNLALPPPGQNACLALMPLPNGQVLCSNGLISLYTPSGTPNPAWAPTVSNVSSTIQPGHTYPISGTQFNGLSQAVAFGDDYQGATNYPLVRIVNTATGHVYYARTHDHSSMGVATGSTPVSTNFDVPAAVEAGPATLLVVTNGIASQPVNVTVTGPALTFSPTTLTFGIQQMGVPSAPQSVTITSSGTTAVSISGISIAGANSAEFSQTGNCGSSLAAGSSCVVSVTFTPSGFRARTAALTVNDNVTGPQSVALTGTGVSGLPAPVILSLSPTFAFAHNPSFTLTVTGSSFLLGTTLQWNQTALVTAVINSTTLTATVPAALIASAGNASITVVNPDGVTSQALAFTVLAVPNPQILSITNTADGSLNWTSAGTEGSNLAPGSVIMISGIDLALTAAEAGPGALPFTLGGVSVAIHSKPAGIYYVNPGVHGTATSQIVVQIPYDAAPPPSAAQVEDIAITNNGVIVPSSIVYFSAFSPAIYTIDGSGSGYAEAYFGEARDPRFGEFAAPSGTFPGLPTQPATAGDVITIYATGLGPVTPALANGATPDPNHPSLTVTTPTVLIGTAPATFVSAAMSPFPGIYQVTVKVPTGISPDAAASLKIQIGGVTSSAATVIAIK